MKRSIIYDSPFCMSVRYMVNIGYSGLTILPHIDEIVVGKRFLRISACIDVDIFLLFPFTCFGEHFRKEFLRKVIGLLLLGLVFSVLRRSLP